MKVQGNIPAYPRPFNESTDRINDGDYPQNGMTLLDHFAGLAMKAICSTGDWNDIIGHENKISDMSYSVAAAMLKARQQYL